MNKDIQNTGNNIELQYCIYTNTNQSGNTGMDLSWMQPRTCKLAGDCCLFVLFLGKKNRLKKKINKKNIGKQTGPNESSAQELYLNDQILEEINSSAILVNVPFITNSREFFRVTWVDKITTTVC